MSKSSRTTAADDIFFDAISNGMTVARAADKAGYSLSTVYYHKKEDLSFADRWDIARETAIQIMEEEADRRAIQGIDKPVYYLGQLVDTVKEYSDQLLIFRLKAMRPEVYRDRTTTEHQGPGGGPILHSTLKLEELSEDERRTIRKIINKRLEQSVQDSG